MSHFNLTTPGAKMLSWIQRMMAVARGAKAGQDVDSLSLPLRSASSTSSPITLLGSVWSPPGWMKQNNNLQWQYVDAWVKYMVSYIQQYRAAGVHVDAVTLQNEPLHSADEAWTMYMDASYQGILANRLGAALAAEARADDGKRISTNDAVRAQTTAIWAYDHNTDHPEYPQYVLENASKYVSTVAWHCYSGTSGWEVLSAFREANPHAKQYMTECWTHSPGEGFFDLPSFVMGPLQNWANGAMAWTLGGSTAFNVAYPGGCKPCSGLVQVDMDAGTYSFTSDYYTMGQFSAFVRRNATYQTSTGGHVYPDKTGVVVTAFVNPATASTLVGGEAAPAAAAAAVVVGRRVVVIQNRIRNDLNITVTFKSGDSFVGLVRGRSVTTWVV